MANVQQRVATMTAIRLLPAPADVSSSSSTDQNVALIRSSSPYSSTSNSSLASQRGDCAYPSDSYIWTATAGDDGSFTFYAMPRQDSASYGSSSASNYFSAQSQAAGWSASHDAITQYSLYNELPLGLYGENGKGTLVNIYA
jgi:hypothetical protein